MYCALIVLPRHATLKRLVAAVFDIYFGRYFGRGRTYPIELRLMPSNIILAEGFTLLYSIFFYESSLPHDYDYDH